MPVVLRESGFRFYFYSMEGNEPPHVHVDKGGASAKYWLEPIRIASNRNYGPTELRRISQILFEHQTELLRQWHEYFDS
ncbi:MAG: DUF4160 domain-containing protein [Pedosphaera sp.]|nr:DUF4160 domain-containing protein [Pedosphaera sp.]